MVWQWQGHLQGADSPLSGMVALLFAMQLLGSALDQTKMSRRIAFIVLAGEPWGYIGSKQFLWQLDRQSDSVNGLTLDSIDHVKPTSKNQISITILSLDCWVSLPNDMMTYASRYHGLLPKGPAHLLIISCGDLQGVNELWTIVCPIYSIASCLVPYLRQGCQCAIILDISFSQQFILNTSCLLRGKNLCILQLCWTHAECQHCMLIGNDLASTRVQKFPAHSVTSKYCPSKGMYWSNDMIIQREECKTLHLLP